MKAEKKSRIGDKVDKEKINVDNKRRVTLGKRAEGISSYSVEELEDGKLLLTPFVEIPADELWLWQDKGALASVRHGLEQSASGQTKAVNWRKKLSGR